MRRQHVRDARTIPSDGRCRHSEPHRAHFPIGFGFGRYGHPASHPINGNNPAIIQISASYTDLGATITGPQADLNLGIKTFVNGLFVSNIQLDTSAAATDTIDYVVTDRTGSRARPPAQ